MIWHLAATDGESLCGSTIGPITVSVERSNCVECLTVLSRSNPHMPTPVCPQPVLHADHLPFRCHCACSDPACVALNRVSRAAR